jgi:L-fucose isomerase-like protein
MTGLKILAFKGASDKLFENGKSQINELFPANDFDLNTQNPDILFFLSGGSEREALNYSKPGKFLLLAAFEENNSYAAATEVKAHFDKIGQDCLLCDLKNVNDRQVILDFIEAGKACERINGKRLGLIGEVSEWLVASTIPGEILASKLGIGLVRIPWNEVRNYNEFTPDPAFLETYKTDSTLNIRDAGRVHQALTEIISRKKLDAITVECFSLVNENGVTACLGLSKLNDDHIPAGCEGDLASITGIMIAKEVTGIIPWMANTVKVDAESVKFAHCTAPTKLLSEFKIETHYETGLGTAVKGSFKGDEITIFRIDNTLEKAFLTTGTIISRPESKDACRTQIEVKISEKASELLKNKPLGNHHLIIPGNQTEKLGIFCKLKNIMVINS